MSGRNISLNRNYKSNDDDDDDDMDPPDDDDEFDEELPPSEDEFEDGSFPDEDEDGQPPLPDEEYGFDSEDDEDEFDDESLPSDVDESFPEDDPDDEPEDEPSSDSIHDSDISMSEPSITPSDNSQGQINRKSVSSAALRGGITRPNIKKPSLYTDPVATDPKILAELDLLTEGLSIKEPPTLVKRQSATISLSQLNSQPTGRQSILKAFTADVSNTITAPAPKQQADERRKSAQVMPPEKKFSAEGFLNCIGKFEGDPFERLFVKVSKDDKLLTVATLCDDIMEFNLASKAYIFEDTEDSSAAVLDYHQNPIVFKFFSPDELVLFMKDLPDEVFMSPEAAAAAEAAEKEELAKKAASSAKKPPVKKILPPPLIEHVKGTSVEDILEDEFESPESRQNRIDKMFSGNDIALDAPGPPRKKELADAYIKKPKYSVRRVVLLCEWINSLHLWPANLCVRSIHQETCTGLLLTKLVKKLNPDAQFVNLNEKALTKKAAIENLEQALGYIWRSKSLNNTRVPSAEDIYNGKTYKTAILFNELFSVYIQQPMYKNAVRIIRWYHNVLKQYQMPLPDYVLEEGDLSGVWPHFQSGIALFCILYHFYGTTLIGSGMNAQRVDPLKMSSIPTNICDYRDNMKYVFSLLRILNIDVIWTAEDWISNPDTEFIMLQLSYIYERFKNNQCALPPAQGDIPGVTSGPNGEPIVVGIVYKDAPAKSKFIIKPKKAVRLGYDSDSMPLLPVDGVYKNTRFMCSGHLPRGMLGKDSKLDHSPVVELREIRANMKGDGWNSRTAIQTEKEKKAEVANPVVSLLRTHVRRAKNSAGNGADSSQPKDGNSTVRGADGSATINSSGNKSNNNQQAVQEAKDINREIRQMVQSLEEEMAAAQAAMSQFEDALAQKYIDLEENAGNSSIDQYAAALEELEKERVELEAEKARLQDHFSRKLLLIKSRKDDAQKVALEIQKARLAEEEAAAAAAAKAAASKQAAKKSTSNPVPNKEAAEKGWNSINMKMSQHNFVLRQKEEAASAVFKAKMTPKKLSSKEQSHKATNSQRSVGSNVMNNDIVDSDLQSMAMSTRASTVPLTPEEQVRLSFDKFKYKIRTASLKWAASREHKNRSTLPSAFSMAPKPTTVELISVPAKGFAATMSTKATESLQVPAPSSSSSAAVFQAITGNAAIRAKELAAMKYEDERRRMVLTERFLDQSLHQTKNMFNPNQEQAQQGQGQGQGEPRSPLRYGSAFSPSGPQHMNMQVALRFLAVTRTMVLNERNQKSYNFELVDWATPQEHDEGITRYTFVWRLPSTGAGVGGGSDEAVEGFASVEDIVDVDTAQTDPSVLRLYLTESTRAVKNAKGRTIISFKCNSKLDCEQYLNAFVCLLSSLH